MLERVTGLFSLSGLATFYFVTVGERESLAVLGFLIQGRKFVLGMRPIMVLPLDFVFCVRGVGVLKEGLMMDLGDALA